MMIWTELKPLAVRARGPQIGVSASVIGKYRSAVAYLTFNHELCLELGLDGVTNTTARVDIGSGDRAGWMRVTAKTGHHKFSTTGPKGQNKALRLVLRLPSHLSQKIALTHINDLTVDTGLIFGERWVAFEMPAFLDAMYSNGGTVKTVEAETQEQAAPTKVPKVERVKLKPITTSVSPASAPPVIAQPRFGLEGRSFMLDGKPLITLQADEISLVRLLIAKSGAVMTRPEAAKLEPTPQVPMARLKKRLKGYPVCIEEWQTGWALVSEAAA